MKPFSKLVLATTASVMLSTQLTIPAANAFVLNPVTAVEFAKGASTALGAGEVTSTGLLSVCSGAVLVCSTIGVAAVAAGMYAAWRATQPSSSVPSSDGSYTNTTGGYVSVRGSAQPAGYNIVIIAPGQGYTIDHSTSTYLTFKVTTNATSGGPYCPVSNAGASWFSSATNSVWEFIPVTNCGTGTQGTKLGTVPADFSNMTAQQKLDAVPLYQTGISSGTITPPAIPSPTGDTATPPSNDTGKKLRPDCKSEKAAIDVFKNAYTDAVRYASQSASQSAQDAVTSTKAAYLGKVRNLTNIPVLYENDPDGTIQAACQDISKQATDATTADKPTADKTANDTSGTTAKTALQTKIQALITAMTDKFNYVGTVSTAGPSCVNLSWGYKGSNITQELCQLNFIFHALGMIMVASAGLWFVRDL